MNLNLKNHLKAELIVFFIAGMFVFNIADNLHILLKLFGIFFVLGAFNTFYIFIKVINCNIYNNNIALIIFLFTFGLQWVIHSIIIMPLILCEILCIVTGKIYIGTNSTILNGMYKKSLKWNFSNEHERFLYNGIIKEYKRKNILKSFMFLISMFIIYMIRYLQIANYLVFLIGIVIVLINLLIYYSVRNRIIINANKPMHVLLCDECDSKSYYHVYKALNNKYPTNNIFLQRYLIALRVDNNDFSELKEILRYYKNFNKQVFYINALIDSLDGIKKIETLEENYHNIKACNLKLLKQTKKIEFENNIKYLEIKSLQFKKNYTDALKICKTVELDGTQLGSIKKAFVLGECFLSLNRFSEAKTNFKYVLEKGNTLRMKYQASVYLEELKTTE